VRKLHKHLFSSINERRAALEHRPSKTQIRSDESASAKPTKQGNAAMKFYEGVIGFGLLLSAVSTIGMSARAAELKAKSVILVHGAFADGSSWHKVVPYLENAGLNEDERRRARG
jgi:hypothetical protein